MTGPWGGAFQGVRRYPSAAIRAEQAAQPVVDEPVEFGVIVAEPVDRPRPLREERDAG